MRITDLGELTGEIVLFGGVYSNLQAWLAMRAVIGDRAAICTGDVVAYCADAEASATALRLSGIPCVAGNCEVQLAENAEDCGCGFAEGTACDVMSGAWFAHATAEIGDENRRWMGDLPDVILFQAHGRRVAVLHGAVSDVARFVWSTSMEAEFLHEISLLERALSKMDESLRPVHDVVAGHSGLPFIRQLGARHWINAGAIGMPPHDGLPSTRYSVLDDQGWRIEELSYDWKTAQSAMRAAGLTQGYDRALETGYWPSEDVLPEALRRSASG